MIQTPRQIFNADVTMPIVSIGRMEWADDDVVWAAKQLHPANSLKQAMKKLRASGIITTRIISGEITNIWGDEVPAHWVKHELKL